MAIEKRVLDAARLTGMQTAEFQTSAEWIVGLWGLRTTGRVRLDGQKILVEVVVPPGSGIAPGSIVTGNLTHAIVPTSVGPVPASVPAPTERAAGGDS